MSVLLKEWLQSEECYQTLRLCAGQVITKAEKRGLVLEEGYLEGETYRDAVTGQLCKFLGDHAEALADRGCAFLATGDVAGFSSYLTAAFIMHQQDVRRTVSPFHAYYRDMRRVLSQEQRLRYGPSGRTGSYYTFSDNDRLAFLPTSYHEGDYSGWPRPAVPYQEIHEKRAMLLLARHFWDNAEEVFLQEYLLPIRELVRFVAAMYSLLSTVTNESDMEHAEDDDGMMPGVGDHLPAADRVTFDDSWRRQLPVIMLDIVDTQLERLARDCVAELTDVERDVVLRLDASETLEKIAAALGLAGPSGVSYHKKLAYQKLRTTWSLWGPPSRRQFERVDEEEFFLFYEKVLSFCKFSGANRNTSAETSS